LLSKENKWWKSGKRIGNVVRNVSFSVLVLEPKALPMLGKLSTTGIHPKPGTVFS
jgi:hypothetical protein